MSDITQPASQPEEDEASSPISPLEHLDSLSPDEARKFDDELGVAGTQAIGGLAGDDGP